MSLNNGQANTAHLLSLPAEIHHQVLEEVSKLTHGKQALRCLSQTCTFFFHLFKHELYHTITLKADSKSGRSLQRITAGPRALLVKKLVFRTHDPRPAWEKQHDPRYRLSVPSKQVLMLLHRFPNLQEFELDVDWKLDLWFSEHPEPRLYPISGHSETYRFILDETLRALGRSVHHNKARALPKLTVRRLPPRIYKALIDHGLHALLNDIRSFHIELLHHTKIPIPQAHHKFISNLPTYFLNHLSNVRTLHLQGSAGSLVGEGHGIPVIDLKNLKIPYLRKLKLEHFVLGKSTESFILRHLGTLYSVTLSDCYKDQNWYMLFRRVMGRKPSKLTRFDVSEPPSDGFNALQRDDGNYDDSARDSSLPIPRAFPRVQTYCGHTWINREDELEELEHGQSVAIWRQLQSVVLANRKCWERFSANKLVRRTI